MAKRVAGGVAATWIRLTIVTLTTLLQTPILFRHIPPAELGIWYLFFTIATFINLSDLGLPSSFSRAVSYIWGRNRSKFDSMPEEIPSAYHNIILGDLYVSALLAIFSMAFFFCLLVLPAALLYFSRALDITAIPSGINRPLFLFFLGVVFNLAASIPNVAISGMGDVSWDNGLRTFVSMIGFALVMIAVPVYKNLEILSAIYLFQGVLALTLGHLTLCRRHRLRIFSPGRVVRGAVTTMYRESVPVFVSRMGLWLIMETNLLIAGYYLGADKVADFAVLRQIVSLGMSVTTAIPMAVSPHVSAAHSTGETVKVRELYLAALRFSLITNLIWSAGLLLWTPEVMTLWLGKSHFLGYRVLIPVVIASFLELHAATHGFFSWSIGKWPFAPSSVIGGILNVLLASGGCFLFGYEGLAWGTLLAQATTNCWYIVWYTMRQIGVSFTDYSRNLLLPGGFYLIALFAVGTTIRRLLSAFLPLGGGNQKSAGYLFTASGILLTAITAAGIAWFMMLRKNDRDYFISLTRRP